MPEKRPGSRTAEARRDRIPAGTPTPALGASSSSFSSARSDLAVCFAFEPAGRPNVVGLTAGGDAYVDLSGELQKNHPGGTTNEVLTIYSLVSALTSNLPAVTGVQILIDGREVDTLAGHVDLRRPIEQDSRWVTQ